jgi:hypothetical protein
MTRPPPPTDEQLRLAFRQVSRPGWPSTLEAALHHPVFRTCLVNMARNLNRRGMDRAPVPQAPPLADLPLFKGLEE